MIGFLRRQPHGHASVEPVASVRVNKGTFALCVEMLGTVANGVMQQMAVYAQAKSIATGRKIRYGTING
jgi:hypothetical protein